MNTKEKARRYDAQQMVEKFNALFPVGNKVVLRKTSTKSCPYEEHVVRAEAFVSGNGDPVCFFNEISGYFSIDKNFIKYPKN
jgi:hypothetical protein